MISVLFLMFYTMDLIKLFYRSINVANRVPSYRGNLPKESQIAF